MFENMSDRWRSTGTYSLRANRSAHCQTGPSASADYGRVCAKRATFEAFATLRHSRHDTVALSLAWLHRRLDIQPSCLEALRMAGWHGGGGITQLPSLRKQLRGPPGRRAGRSQRRTHGQAYRSLPPQPWCLPGYKRCCWPCCRLRARFRLLRQ